MCAISEGMPLLLSRPALGVWLIAVVASLTAPRPLPAADWPEFRGPSGQGYSGDTGAPLSWNESENIAWKTPLPGRGWSSPVIAGNEVWLTVSNDRGRSLRAISLDAGTGQMRHDVEVFRFERPPAIHEKNSYASPTPIIEGGRVYVHFGMLGTAALTRDGKLLWENQQLRYQHGHGPGGSPALSGDLLIINCDGTDVQYVAALDKDTGALRWQTDRPSARMAFSTPLVIDAGDSRQVVSVGGDRAVSYDLETGEELWWIRFHGFSGVPRPVFGHGLVYLTTGFYNPEVIAVRPDGRGDVTSSHIAWQSSRGAPLTPSPLLVGEELYFVSDRGIATCLDAKTGRQHWQARFRGAFSASPVYADGRIYFLNESGETSVIAAGQEFKKLAQNQLGTKTLASIAVSGAAIFLRTESHLYRIEEK